MLPILALITVIALVCLLPVSLVLFLMYVACQAWRKPSPRRAARLLTFAMPAVVLIGLTILAVGACDRQMLLDRLPRPLEVAAVEYRLEESWGLGFMPGDNETGFVVYRLTRQSAEWARDQGGLLGDRLAGGTAQWHRTPVSDTCDERWHPHDDTPQKKGAAPCPFHSPTIAEYLGRYGFFISIEKGRDAEVDQAIQAGGSFYAYGRDRSVTIVDPARGKVYFAYAG